jgi:hypothetical protein
MLRLCRLRQPLLHQLLLLTPSRQLHLRPTQQQLKQQQQQQQQQQQWTRQSYHLLTLRPFPPQTLR